MFQIPQVGEHGRMRANFFIIMLLFWVSLEAQTMCWEVNGTHGGKVYLLGSVHVGKESMYPMHPRIEEAFKSSDYLFLEVKSSEDATVAMNLAMFKEGRYEGNATLATSVSAPTYTRVQSWLAAYEMPLKSMDPFKPWVVAVNMTMLEAMKLGFSPVYGIDRYFESKATHASKPIYSLESIKDQINAMRFDEGSFQEDFLKMVLEDKMSSAQEIQMLLDAYHEGNVTFFHDHLLAPMQNYPLVREKFLIERNTKMYSNIKRYINSKKGRNYFIIVGLAHLLGEGGLLQLIEADGYATLRLE